MSASLEYYAMDGIKMTESFAVNMEVDLNTYLPVYNVHNTIKGTDTSITEAEYEAYQKECTPLTEWKTLESKSAKRILEKHRHPIRNGKRHTHSFTERRV